MKLSFEEARNILYKGGVVAVPTETVYGLAADATNPKAVEKIFQIKNRPGDNPLICHFHSFEAAKKFLNPVPAYVSKLAAHLSPGPVSYLLSLKTPSSLRAATRNRTDVIIRVPMHELLLKLLRELPFPLAAPSANTSGKFSATNAKMIEADLGNKIDGVLDGGNSSVGIESTILDCRDENKIRILRPGAIGKEDVEWILRDENILVEENVSMMITTPGSKYKHYSPTTPLHEIFSVENISPEKKQTAVLGLSEDLKNLSLKKNIQLISLGSEKNLTEVAANLYHKLFELDATKVDEAFFINRDWGNSSLGKAISNRVNHILAK